MVLGSHLGIVCRFAFGLPLTAYLSAYFEALFWLLLRLLLLLLLLLFLTEFVDLLLQLSLVVFFVLVTCCCNLLVVVICEILSLVETYKKVLEQDFGNFEKKNIYLDSGN